MEVPDRQGECSMGTWCFAVVLILQLRVVSNHGESQVTSSACVLQGSVKHGLNAYDRKQVFQFETNFSWFAMLHKDMQP